MAATEVIRLLIVAGSAKVKPMTASISLRCTARRVVSLNKQLRAGRKDLGSSCGQLAGGMPGEYAARKSPTGLTSLWPGGSMNTIR